MNYTEQEQKVLGWVRTLAKSKGSYGRLYDELIADPDKLQALASQNFSNAVDMVMWLEC